ncbi:unnamed protein product [Trichobilharzia regenti]|nr:unnamed protein product [Trichobilharzia regenti]
MNSSRQYSEKLECRVQDLINHSNCQPSSESLSFENLEENTSDSLYTMSDAKPLNTSQPAIKTLTTPSTTTKPATTTTTPASASSAPKVDDILLQQTINTFQSLLDERDQEIGQLKKYIQQNKQDNNNNQLTFFSNSGGGGGGEDVNLPKLCESSIQTELNNEQMNKLSTLKETLNSGGHILTNQEYETLNNELKQTLVTLANNPDNTDKSTTEGQLNQDNIDNNDLLLTANKLRKLSQGMKIKSTLPETKPSNK